MEAAPVPAVPPKPNDTPARSARMPGEDRRRQLLRVAVESFAQNGFSGTKTKDIAAAAGVSEAILFRHFASKEDLYHAILDEKEATLGADRWFVELNELAERRDDRGLFQHVARQLIRSFREDAAFHRLLLYASLEGHLLADLFHERFGLPMGDFLCRYVALRQREGAFRECDRGRRRDVCHRVGSPLRDGTPHFGSNEFSAFRRGNRGSICGPDSSWPGTAADSHRPGTAARHRPVSKRKAEGMTNRVSSQSVGLMLAGIALLAASGCSNSNKNVSLTEAATGPAKLLKVSTVRALTRQVSSSVQVTGSFLAEESSDVAPPAAGRVTATPVDAGAFVQQGQVLAKLEDRDAQLRLQAALASEEQAEASLHQAESRIGLSQGGKFDANIVPEVLSAKASYDSAVAQAKMSEADAERYDALIKTGDVSQSAYDRARTQADTAKEQTNSARQLYEASLNSARQNFQGVINAQASLAGARAQTAIARKAVDDTVIKAPFTGYISARPIAVGQYVALTSKIATLVRVTPLKLELQVQESNAPQLKIDADVEATVPGYPGRTFRGKVTSINPTVDANSRTVSVEAKFANQDLALKPGMFATSRILLNGSSMGIFVPRTAVLTDPSTNSSQVFFVRDGKARVAVVQLGAVDGEMIQILSGIADNFVIATDHLQDLFDGEPVDTEGTPPAATGALPSRDRTQPVPPGGAGA